MSVARTNRVERSEQMGIKKCDAKYTKPFVGKTNVIVMIAVEGGESTASATQLDYDMVHALEKAIVDCTFIDDEPQTDCRQSGKE